MPEQDGGSADTGVSVPAPGSHDVTLDATAAEESDENANLLVNLDILAGMTESATTRYRDCVKKFAAALGREASRLEEADRAEEIDKPEITTTMVVKANDLLRHPPSNNVVSSIPVIVAQTVSFGLAIATPIIFGVGLPPVWHWTATAMSGILAVASQVYAILAVRRK
jgi:hypothetical protein